MLALEIFVCCLVLWLVFIPSLLINLELFLGQKINKNDYKNTYKRKPCGILIPAHNEELIIAETLRCLQKQVAEYDRILVVADNCSDATVRICHEHGVEVIERTNQIEKGKGYALDYGLQHLASDMPDTIVILDADSQFTSHSLDTLVTQSQVSDSVVQSMYLMQAPSNANIKTRVAEFAWLVKNKIRPVGMAKLGIGCHLQGSGMAFPKQILQNNSLASGCIVEDLELGLKLANNGNKVLFDPESVVISQFPTSTQGTESQRTRWEHGHLSLISSLQKRMLVSILQGKVKAFWLTMDAAIPPTILWLGSVFFFALISTVLIWFNLYIPAYLSWFSFFLLIINLILSWLINGRDIIKLKDILGVLAYILSKFSIYKKFFTARQKDWVRTDRGNDDSK